LHSDLRIAYNSCTLRNMVDLMASCISRDRRDSSIAPANAENRGHEMTTDRRMRDFDRIRLEEARKLSDGDILRHLSDPLTAPDARPLLERALAEHRDAARVRELAHDVMRGLA